MTKKWVIAIPVFAILAWAAGTQQDAKTVYVVGKGTCTQLSQIEDVDGVQINP